MLEHVGGHFEIILCSLDSGRLTRGGPGGCRPPRPLTFLFFPVELLTYFGGVRGEAFCPYEALVERTGGSSSR